MTYAGYKRIQHIAQAILTKFVNAGLAERASGPCRDCGTTRYVISDHRSYSDPLAVEPACVSCNEKRGPGAIDFYHVETLQMVRIRFKRVIRRERAAA